MLTVVHLPAVKSYQGLFVPWVNLKGTLEVYELFNFQLTDWAKLAHHESANAGINWPWPNDGKHTDKLFWGFLGWAKSLTGTGDLAFNDICGLLYPADTAAVLHGKCSVSRCSCLKSLSVLYCHREQQGHDQDVYSLDVPAHNGNNINGCDRCNLRLLSHVTRTVVLNPSTCTPQLHSLRNIVL